MLLAILGLLPAVPHIIISVEHMMGTGPAPPRSKQPPQ